MRGRARAWVASAAALVLGACASRLPLVSDEGAPAPVPPRLPAHRAVDDLEISWRGHALTFVAHVAVEPPPGPVRVHLGTESGLTVLDLEVRGGAAVVHAASDLAEAPAFREAVARDIDRIYGSRSVFALDAGRLPRARIALPHDARRALGLSDGSWIVASPEVFAGGASDFAVALLDRERREEARIRYSDVGGDGVPRSVRLDVPRERRSVKIEVVSVLPATPAGAGGAEPRP